MWPRISIIWLNYNSGRIIELVLKSLEAVASLDYPSDRYELIVVDNGSTDGSFEIVKRYLEGKSGLRKKVVRLEKNLGFTGGNNIGFRARDRDSEYIVLLNNDAIPFQDSLKAMVEHMEQFSYAALQGVILKYGAKNIIDTAGDFHDEFFNSIVAGHGKPFPWIIRKPFYITYADGSYSIYRVEAIRRCVGERLFIDESFAYGDDNYLGLMLWNCGYRIVTIPVVTAEHYRSGTFGRIHGIQWYLLVRNMIALNVVANSRFKSLVNLYALKGFITPTVAKGGLWSLHLQAVRDGLRYGRKLRRKIGPIDIYKAPLVDLSVGEALSLLLMPRRVYAKTMEGKLGRIIEKYQAPSS